ncbi:PglZ domain-containing protein [Rhizobium azibense]|uniref:PglZ domain-containing protein n=1 Tax=Rhizobium azibense TaxID=1136135 RepID=A0A4R3QIW8_9HYPH|nr:PglZ domain-containing protein [Rhizobium azibense]TCU21803.1 PglZ domain-containing protein [Rhizobium azibense]
MSIATFIRDQIFLPRLRLAGCIVVYDSERRYHDQCVSLANERTTVVDASESGIEAREAALSALQEVGKPNSGLDGVLIYVPTKKPQTDEEMQVDPFSIYGKCGAVFPQDDGDEYLSLCLRARPDHITEIRKAFAAMPAGPAFAVIDAIGGGASWPHLRAALGVESGREILAALLVPNDRQSVALKSADAWTDEAREFLRTTLSMTVKTRGKTWGSFADELWRYVLFSEFVFDLPGALPASLKDVPHAPPEARPVVEDVCDRLRNDPRWRSTYVERAETIEAEFDLPNQCAAIEDLGERDTFPFEERTYLRVAIKGITTADVDAARRVLMRHKNSVWLGKGESQAQWELVRSGLNLIEACEDYERQLPDHARSQSDLIDFYVTTLREVDRLHREFEQAVGEFIDPHGMMQEVVQQARLRYRRMAERVQTLFMKHLSASGWPPAGRLANVDVFDHFVGERLKDAGRRVAYILVDALRYELGVALEKMVAEDGPVELQAAYAQLPTITPVGMASLLPDARAQLTLSTETGVLMPKFGSAPVANVGARMDILRKRFGDRFSEMLLSDFARNRLKIASTVDLLVLRSTEIDSQLENNPETTLGLIPATLKLVRVALHKLKGMGFNEAVIVTDHGFFLNAQADHGDVCSKPPGKWTINAHDRMLLGAGNEDAHNLVIAPDKLGIRTDAPQTALPRTMAPYSSGHLYFHGGASLAEAIVPVIVARLDAAEQPSVSRATVELNYRNGSTRITTYVPVIEVSLVSDDMFSQGVSVELLLEAQDAKGRVVGEPRPSADVNPATRTITLLPGQRKQIALGMDREFEGKFTIKALNPSTLASYSTLTLETDYTV